MIPLFKEKQYGYETDKPANGAAPKSSLSLRKGKKWQCAGIQCPAPFRCSGSETQTGLPADSEYIHPQTF